MVTPETRCNLAKTDEICHASKSMLLRLVEDTSGKDHEFVRFKQGAK